MLRSAGWAELATRFIRTSDCEAMVGTDRRVALVAEDFGEALVSAYAAPIPLADT